MDDTGDTFKVFFDVPVQVTLLPEFNDMAWDHALAAAHAAGVIPVGPIHIETETIKPSGLVEGTPMQVASLAQLIAGGGLDVVRVTATMMVGSRLE